MNNFIELTNISKHYGDKVVLERMTTQIAKGEFVTLVGASGCGKSTFLRLLLGTELASSGAITIEGELIEKEPSSERGIVFQKYSVFPHLNARQNVALGIEFERNEKTRLILRMPGLRQLVYPHPPSSIRMSSPAGCNSA